MSKDLVIVAGHALPEPSAYNGRTATVVDGARNANAIFRGAVIRDDIGQVDLSWRYLTVEQWSKINQLFVRRYGGRFINPVRFFSQTSGTFETRNMYPSDLTAGMWRRDPETKEVLGWTDCKLSLTEV